MVTLRSIGGLSAPLSVALDPEVWRKHYAHGLPLGPDLGPGLLASVQQACGEEAAAATAAAIDELSSETISWHLRVAASELQTKLGIPLGIVTVKSPPLDEGVVQGIHFDRLEPRRPYTQGDAKRWYKNEVHGPVISVERVRGYYFGQKVWEFSAARNNLDLIRVEWPRMGSMHTIPVNMTSMLVLQAPSSFYGVFHTLLDHRTPIPDFWGFDYTIGPIERETGEPGKLPLVAVHWIMVVAAQTLLSLAGVARTRGIASQSVSFDGINRSISLSANAQASIYGALETAYKAAEARIDWPRLRTQLKGPRVRRFSH